MTPQPFSEFLTYLREQGIMIGTSEHLAVGKLLAGWNNCNRDVLRSSLSALLGRSLEEVQRIESLFDFYYPTYGNLSPFDETPTIVAGDTRLPSSATGERVNEASRGSIHSALPPWRIALSTRLGVVKKWFLRFGWLLCASIVALGVLAGVLLVRSSIEPPTLDGGTTAVPPLGIPAAPVPATVTQPQPSSLPSHRWVRIALWGCSGLFLILMILYAMRRASLHQMTEQNRADEQLSRMLGPETYEWVLRRLRPALRRDDVEDFGARLGRLCSDLVSGNDLDVDRTVEQLARTGLVATLWRRPRRILQPVLMFIDHGHDTQIFFKSGKLDASLAWIEHSGIPLERWFFDTDATWVSKTPYGEPWRLEKVLKDHPDLPIMILSYGSDLVDLDAVLPHWIATISRRRRCVWVHPVADLDAWPNRLRHKFCIPVWPISRLGLQCAAFELANDQTLRQTLDRDRLSINTPVNHEEVRSLLRIISLVPRPGIQICELLRQIYYPAVPKQFLLHLPLASNNSSNVRLSTTTQTSLQLLAELRQNNPELELSVRQEILSALADSEPLGDSVAHLRWRLDRALQIVQMRVGSQPDSRTNAALADIQALAAGPLKAEATQAMKTLAVPGLSTTLTSAGKWLSGIAIGVVVLMAGGWALTSRFYHQKELPPDDGQPLPFKEVYRRKLTGGWSLKRTKLNLLRVNGAEVFSSASERKIYLKLQILWHKCENGFYNVSSTWLSRTYTGTIYYEGSYSGLVGGFPQTLEWKQSYVSLAPTTPVLAHFLGFIDFTAIRQFDYEMLDNLERCLSSSAGV